MSRYASVQCFHSGAHSAKIQGVERRQYQNSRVFQASKGILYSWSWQIAEFRLISAAMHFTHMQGYSAVS